MFSSIKVSLHLTIHIFQAMYTSVSLLHAKLTMGGGENKQKIEVENQTKT